MSVVLPVVTVFLVPILRSAIKLTFGPLGSTLMACEGDVVHQESVVLEALERVTHFKVDGALMHMDTGKGTALVYRRSHLGSE